jgi:hypothetical protein
MLSRKRMAGIGSSVALTALLLGGGTAANASTFWSNFSTTIGTFGAAAYTGTQQKSYNGDSGGFRPSFIGAGRTISARLYKPSTGARGTERTGVAQGSNVILFNSFQAFDILRTEVAGNPAWVTSTQVDGTWRAN